MEDKKYQEQPIKYGDIFDVSGYLASRLISPQDAVTMQTAEQTALGKTQKGAAAATMQSAAAVNERLGVVGHRDMTDVVRDEGAIVAETDVGARRVVVEALSKHLPSGAGGDKPVDLSDAAAIQAAEVATGVILPGGIGAAAQSAATHNARTLGDEDKTMLGDVLEDATAKLPADKPVTREDAEGVISAEIRNNPLMSARPGGVAESVAAAARLNV
ncbi:hypothetical protein RHGRI_002942 [Rhododendron griersonianum]|uniref:SMP domain-containing protein n=1 Tax=Rhododendron griersonianum TaxID=479676 RepID=A0AAV6LS32_9ERIC|nr:hypothetical protein RHGRI_002942 [Rhododendron griersonianum]